MTVDTAHLPGLLDGLDLIRADFPILARDARRRAPAGLPRQREHLAEAAGASIDAMVDHLERHNANVARAMHQLGAESTAAFEGGRDKVAAFLNAPLARRGDLHQERLRGAQPGGEHARLGARAAGDRPGRRGASITEMEHHSNIVPWQLLTERTGADAALVRAHRRRPARPVEHRRADQRAHQGRRR